MTLPSLLTDGFGRFRRGRFVTSRKQFEMLAEAGQTPEVMVLSCCDSRVPPEVVFDADPGELFVMRNIANLVPPHETTGRYHGVSAAIEFAVLGLKVKHIVILGHSSCGGVRAYLEEAGVVPPAGGQPRRRTEGDFIGSWMSLLEDSREEVLKAMPGRAPGEIQTGLEQASVRSSLKNMRSFACVSTLESRGRLCLHGAHFDIGSGTLSLLDEKTTRFAAVAAGED